MQSESFEKSQFAARLHHVLDQRDDLESDASLCEYARADEDAATMLRAAELIAAPPAIVHYPSADFADRILAKIQEADALEMRQRQAPIWRRKAGLYWAAGLATAICLAVGLGVWNSVPEPSQVAKIPAANDPAVAIAPTESELEGLESEEARKALLEQFAVREDKVAELRSGLKPFRSTLNVTLHVLRSTVPTRTPQPPRRPVEGKPSTMLLHSKWIV